MPLRHCGHRNGPQTCVGSGKMTDAVKGCSHNRGDGELPDDLARLAQEFFSEAETPEEIAERRAWQKLSLEVLAHDDKDS